MKHVDLHLHSTASDGKLTPSELVRKAIDMNMYGLSITDHDSINGIYEAQKAAEGKIKFIPGIEISCYETKRGFEEVHILGYFIDCEKQELKDLLEKTRQERINQKKKIVEKLNDLGFEINFNEVLKLAKGEVGRPHVAEVLVKKYPNKFSSVSDVFDKYIGLGKPAYTGREDKTSVFEAVTIIKKSGGIPILAHPGVYSDSDALELIAYFLDCGGLGIETYYPYSKINGVSKEEEQRKISFFKKVVADKNLIESGGSDFHGNTRDTQIDEMKIPAYVLDKLEDYINA